MGRLLITNNNNWNNKLKSVNKNIGLIESNSAEFNGVALTVYKKIKIDNCNYYEEDNGMVMCSGTFFYKGMFGKEALKKILQDSINTDICEMRKFLLGSYVILIKRDNHIKIFIDETQTYAFYYYQMGGFYILTNLYIQIAAVTQTSINEDAFLERLIRTATLNNCTPFNYIYKVCSNQCVDINLISGMMDVKEIQVNRYDYSFNTAQEALELLYDRIHKITLLRNSHIHSYLHFYTGGVDSRLELAFSLQNNNSVKLGYWMGNDCITNGTSGDLKVIEESAKQLKLPFEVYDVSENYVDCIKNITIEKCMKYGEYTSIYASNPKWIAIFENLDKGIECLVFGFFGEIFRPISELDKSYKNNYKMIDFITDVYCRTGIEKEIFFLEGFYEYLLDECKNIVNKTEIISKKDAFDIFTFSRYSADCVRNNFANIFTYSFPILSQKEIKDINYKINYDWRTGDFFSLQLTKLFNDNLLKIPYFTHHHHVNYNSKKGILEETNLTKYKDVVKEKIKDTELMSLYHKFFQKYLHPNTLKNQQIFDFSLDYINSSKLIGESKISVQDIPKWNNIEIPTLATAVAEIKIAETINNESYR
ncbi:MAG: hypothetical protein IJ583_07295 [Firmicutes bacterium]|nr:hypothetical protein [Bacillota bacterium]